MRIASPSNPSDEDKLLQKVRKLAKRFARRLVDPDDADDLAQQVVIECHARLLRDRFRVDTSLRGVVRSIVRRRFSRNLRDAHAPETVGVSHIEARTIRTPVWMNPAAVFEMSEADTVRDRALAELTERCRTAYLLVREKQATYRDVAAEMDISVGLVANYVKSAEQHLASRVLYRRLPLKSVLSVDHRSAAPRRPTNAEAPRRRVVSAPFAGATVRTTRATERPPRPMQMYAEPTAPHSRPIAKVAEPTSNYERTSPNFK